MKMNIIFIAVKILLTPELLNINPIVAFSKTETKIDHNH